MKKKKVWWKSRTLWANAVVGALVALEAKTDLLQPFLPVNFYSAVAVGLPVLNAMLRVITSTGIGLRENDNDAVQS